MFMAENVYDLFVFMRGLLTENHFVQYVAVRNDACWEHLFLTINLVFLYLLSEFLLLICKYLLLFQFLYTFC